VQDPSSSWGLMILDGQGVIEHDPQVALIPAGALLFTVVSLNVLAERFRKLFGVREAAL
jgi:peptide/nickel transport system permease protein